MIIPRLHDTTVLNEQPLFVQAVVKPGCTTGFTTGCIHDTAGCQTGCKTGFTTGWMFVYTIQPVVNPVWQPVWQQVVSCKRRFRVHRVSVGLSHLHTRADLTLVECRHFGPTRQWLELLQLNLLKEQYSTVWIYQSPSLNPEILLWRKFPWLGTHTLGSVTVARL